MSCCCASALSARSKLRVTQHVVQRIQYEKEGAVELECGHGEGGRKLGARQALRAAEWHVLELDEERERVCIVASLRAVRRDGEWKVEGSDA